MDAWIEYVTLVTDVLVLAENLAAPAESVKTFLFSCAASMHCCGGCCCCAFDCWSTRRRRDSDILSESIIAEES